ncbi:MAG: hypothetical protein GY953_48380, partial [bacterium]|nr:hypothetical protein [bacterium]
MTALALLALLGDPIDRRRVEHAQLVTRGLSWLMSRQDPETGAFWGRQTRIGKLLRGRRILPTRSHYNSALAVYALSEACGMYGRSGELGRRAQIGVDFLLRARNLDQGWGYQYPPAGESNMSLTGWVGLALVAAREAGITVEPAAFRQLLALIDANTNRHNLRTGYRQ